VLHWLRAEPCEEILSEVPGTELLSLLWRSRYDPLDEISQTVFLTGLQRHEEAALAQLIARKRPPGGMIEARQTLDTLEVARVQSLIQRSKARLRQPGMTVDDMAAEQELIKELTAQLKESLDRLRPAQH
jgi:hypothetical protein